MDTDKTILTAGKYTPARGVQTVGRGSRRDAANDPRDARAPRIFVPTLTGARDRVKLREWYWNEIKEGGYLCEYLAAEKRKTPAMIRRVARMMAGFEQNNQSDFRRLAAVPARLYHRWKDEDKDFFEDDDNLRSLKRDNPDLPVYVGPKRVKGQRFRYGEHRTSNTEHRTPNGKQLAAGTAALP